MDLQSSAQWAHQPVATPLGERVHFGSPELIAHSEVHSPQGQANLHACFEFDGATTNRRAP